MSDEAIQHEPSTATLRRELHALTSDVPAVLDLIARWLQAASSDLHALNRTSEAGYLDYLAEHVRLNGKQEAKK